MITPKQCDIIAKLYDCGFSEMNIGKIAKKTKRTYSNVGKAIGILGDKGLVKYKIKGRQKIIKLTNKGEEFAKHFKIIEELCK